MTTPHRLLALISLVILLALGLLTGCGQPASPDKAPTPALAPVAAIAPANAWWNDTVFYEVFVRSFYDSNGDGIGDLAGLIEKLDYLNDGDPTTTDDLGVTGIWLMPVAQSPSYHGYDTTDYYTIEEDYGSNEDFKRLIDEAHRRGIKVLVDLVLNHTSNQHPWFVDSASGLDAEKRDWYIWRPSDDGSALPAGTYQMRDLLNDGDAAPLTTTADGFQRYAPLPSLVARAGHILLLDQ